MGLILAADDLRPNMYVAILSRRSSERTRERRREHSEPHMVPTMGPGIPLRVLEISLPFVACIVLEPDGCEVGITIIDFRMVKMCKLKRRFIDAIKRYASERETDESDVHPESQEHSDLNA